MKKKNDIFYVLWSSAIVICSALAIFTLIFVSCAGPEQPPEDTPPQDEQTVSPSADAENPPESAPPDDPVQTTDPAQATEPVDDTMSTAPVTSTVLGETEDMGQEYVDKFIFLGDSTTYGLGHYGVVDKNQVWTPPSGTLTLSFWSVAAILYPDTGSEVLIPEAVEAKKPEYMLITLGVNGVSFMEEEYFKEEYTNLVNAVKEKSPDTKIILNSIYPVAMSYKYIRDISNEKITAANEWIKKVAEDTGVKYLDSASVLVGQNGFLPENLQNGDGLHLTEESFNLVIDYLRTHGYK